MAPPEVLILKETFSAWNYDGSSDAVAQSGSWLRDAEEATGRKRGRCSFDGCGRQAEVGGHVHMARIGCVIAPICRECNNPNNQSRRMGAGARLRKNIEVTRSDVTEGMRNAVRRTPDAKTAGGKRQRHSRLCESCNDDIASRPAGHTQCYSCWRAAQDGKYDDDEAEEGEVEDDEGEEEDDEGEEEEEEEDDDDDGEGDCDDYE